MKTQKILLLILVSASFFTVTGCAKLKEFQQKRTTTEEAAAAAAEAIAAAQAETMYAVNVYKTQAGNLDAYLDFGGDVVSETSVDILPEMAGKLSKMNIVVGDTVKKNQIIGYVDPSKPGMTYAASPIKAPIGGTVISLPVPEGSTVSQATSLGKISMTNELEITMSVAERFISRIKLGQTAYLTFDAYPSEQFSAKVTKMSPVVDTSSRTMTVTLKVEPADSRIKAGMYARIKLITENKSNVIAIPYAALVSRAGETFVFIVSGENSVRKQKVSQGIRVDDKVEIIDGVASGDTVVIKGQTLLEDGSKINIVSTETAQQGAQ